MLRTVRLWWNRFGPMFAAEIRRRRVESLRAVPQWRWHLDEVFVKINGEMRYLWRAVDHEGEVLEVFATKRRDRKAALAFLKRSMARFRDIMTLQKFASAYASIHNHFNHDPHLNQGARFIENRSATLAEWRELEA